MSLEKSLVVLPRRYAFFHEVRSLLSRSRHRGARHLCQPVPIATRQSAQNCQDVPLRTTLAICSRAARRSSIDSPRNNSTHLFRAC